MRLSQSKSDKNLTFVIENLMKNIHMGTNKSFVSPVSIIYRCHFLWCEKC